MIVPDKYVGLERSLLGQSAELIAAARSDQTVLDLWTTVARSDGDWTFPRFALALSLLFGLAVVRLDGGLLVWSHR